MGGDGQGWSELPGSSCPGCGLLAPSTSSRNVLEPYLYTDTLPASPEPTEQRPELPVTLVRAGGPCACPRGAVVWGLLGKLLFCRCLERAGVALRAVRFWRVMFGFYSDYFGSLFSLFLLTSLPPKCVQ